MKNTDPTFEELESVRQRIMDAQQNVPSFAQWVGTYALNDVHWLLGVIDGINQNFGILVEILKLLIEVLHYHKEEDVNNPEETSASGSPSTSQAPPF